MIDLYTQAVLSLHITASDDFQKARAAYLAHNEQRPTDHRLIDAWLAESERLFAAYESAYDALQWLEKISPLSRLASKAVGL